MMYKYISIVFLLVISINCNSIDKPPVKTAVSPSQIPKKKVSVKKSKNVSRKVKHIEGSVNILFCGDVMLDWGIRDIFETKGYRYPLRELKDFLSQFDYRFCNLESPISDKGKPHLTKKYIFRAKPEEVKILKYGDFNGVSLANNHSNDFGKEALLDTLDILIKNNISYAGAGSDICSARLPLSLEIEGINIALFAYSDIAYKESYATDISSGIAKADLDSIIEDIQQFKSIYHFIIISIHWGEEYSDYPTEQQIEMAHKIIDSGADVIIGHHPHVYQGIEIYKGKPVIYSLGNFIFGSINEDIRHNIVVGIRFLKEGIHSLNIYAINGNKDTRKPFHHTLLEGKEAVDSLIHLLKLSETLGSAFSQRAYIKDSVLYYSFSTEMLTGINTE
ncbi:MAG: CapA family protein [Spirochaetota bacterium]|nr:CapA family protein [Spirochaetota bacterium]